MKFSKERLLRKSMKIVGSLFLFLATIVIVPTSIGVGHQPKCPDEFLR
ncbi:cyclic lactone autoinducer peptide [Clostridium kluyveri]|uniref:Cyclic lactone autoinducer peptide n=1 Tax=Clostridium kluyveri TaxID=1534 RepID=A0A1L5FC27_CLOKL|nr:cyclic lactone autoinducer peptide [Clostridium kluyveri]APM40523.1 hypothetical protein BS101_18220 [Clostridium kluyveri]